MSVTEGQNPGDNVAHRFRNRLFWRWADEMPRPLREGFLKTLHALGAGANHQGATTFRDGAPITLKQIARAAAVDPKDARRYLDAAAAAGVVRMVGERKRGSTPVYVLVVSDAPDWTAAAGHLAATRSQPKKPRRRVWDEAAKGGCTPNGNGDALASNPVTPESEKGDAPASENGGCTPNRNGDAPGTSQGFPSNYPKDPRGDGRRPTTGSQGRAAGGSAAAPTASPAEEDEKVRTAAIGCVIGLMPRRLRDQLPERLPAAVADEIRAELARGLTVDQLVDRVARRWVEHGYENAAESADGPGILRPVGVARKLVRRGNCPSERCDDGTDLDTGDRCRTCEREAEDRQARREAAQRPVQAAFLMPVPSGPAEPAPQPHTPAQRSSERREIRDCDGPTCERVFRTVPAPAPAGLCFWCRQDAEAATDQAVNA
ncbi:hypothetical protein AB0N20_27340 [Streptomyces griseoincarnatus]